MMLSRMPFGAAIIAASVSSALAQGVPSTVADAARGFAQPGDQVRVTVWPQSAFGPPVTAIVDPEGNIVIPPAGQLRVREIPIGALRDTLKTLLTKYIRQPE